MMGRKNFIVVLDVEMINILTAALYVFNVSLAVKKVSIAKLFKIMILLILINMIINNKIDNYYL